MSDDANTNQIAMLVISGLVVLGFGGVLIGWMFHPPAADGSNMLSAMIGALAGGYLQVINYWFKK